MPAKSSSIARLVDGPVFITRQRCSGCYGNSRVPTPEMAAWEAAVDRHELNMRAAAGSASRGEAETAAGEKPEQQRMDCIGCGGEGFCEREVSVSELEQLLCEASEERREREASGRRRSGNPRFLSISTTR
jgi:hypothetical protein